MSLSLGELSENVGRVVTIRAENLYVNCKIMDVRITFGEVQYRVTPVEGYGTQWITDRRCLPYVNA